MAIAPRVSLGLPVYNGDNFLEPTLRSLLEQTFEDFELIISDNASTDRTREICETYAARDPRVRYVREEENRGMIWNFNRVFELGRGEYFKWAAHDDLVADTFLEICVEQLDRDPELAICCPSASPIDSAGYLFAAENPAKASTGDGRLCDGSGRHRYLDSSSAGSRFRAVVIFSTRCYEEFGLIRSSVIRRTPLRGYYPGSEKVFLAELSLLGRICVLPDLLLFPRIHGQRLSAMRSAKDRLRSYVSKPGSGARVPRQLRCAFGYWSVIHRHPLRWFERLQCYAALTQFLLQFHKWPKVLGNALFRQERTLAPPQASPHRPQLHPRQEPVCPC